jgi:Tfp pilus assembly protein PilO
MHKIILAIFISLSIIVWGLNIGFLRLNQIKKLNKQITQLKNAISGIEQKVYQIPTLQEEVKKLEEAEASFKNKLPTEEEASIDSFFKLLATYSKKTGCEIIRLTKRQASITPEAESQPFTTVTFETNILGNFYNVIKFLSMLETQERLVNIESLAIRKQQVQGEDDLEYSGMPLVFSTYIWKAK